MRLNTVVTLCASAAFGVLAVVLARGWIDDAIQSEFSQSQSAKLISAPKAKTVPVVTALVDLQFGDALTPDVLSVVEYPEGAVPVGSYASIPDVFPDTAQPTLALTYISVNEPLIDHKISGPGGRGSLSSIITDGMRAASIQVNSVTGVAGFIVPGDYVDIIFTHDTSTRRNGSNLTSDILLQSVKVLGIDPNLNDTSDNPSLADTVTVEVSHEEAQKLQLAQRTGSLSLMLRRRGELDVVKTSTLNAKSLVPSARASQPARPRRPRQVAAKKDDGMQVTIVRGEERSAVTVFRDAEKNDFVMNGGDQQ